MKLTEMSGAISPNQNQESLSG